MRHFTLLVAVALAACSPPPDAIRRELAATLGPVRPVEGRLVGGFSYKLFEPGRITNLSTAARTALRSLEVIPEERPLLELFKGQATPAVEALEHLIAEQPGDAQRWSDLAAAYLAESSGPPARPVALAQALDAALRSLEVDPNLAEARFNRALILEQLGLIREAVRAWNEYLKLDPSSAWGTEAENHMKRLTRPTGLAAWRKARQTLMAKAQTRNASQVKTLIHQFPQPVRQLIEEQLLPGWGTAYLARHYGKAAADLDLARFLAIQLAAVSSDAMAEDAIAAINDAEMNRDTPRVTALARGHANFGAALPHLTRHEVERACPLLGLAMRDLLQAKSPFANWSAAHLARCANERQEFPTAREDSLSLIARLDTFRYPALSGQLRLSAGLPLLAGDDPDAALVADRAAVAVFDRLKERENAAQARTNLAEALRFLGADDDAWPLRIQTLADFAWLTPRRRTSALEEAAQAASAEGLLHAALAFREFSLQECDRLGDPSSRAYGRLKRAESLLALGRPLEAATDLSEAQGLAAQIEDAQVRERVKADLSIAESLAVTGDARAEIARHSRALEFYVPKGNRYPLVAIYLARGRALLSAGELDRALSDFQRGIVVVEEVRSQLGEDPFRLSYFKLSVDLFEEAISTLDRLGRRREALEVAEQARSRSLFDRLSANEREEAALLAPETIAAKLPNGLALVEYACLNDRLLAWVLRREGIQSLSIPVGRGVLTATLERLERGFEKRRPEDLDAALTDLHRALIAPLAPVITPSESIVFLPDSTLQTVPFAALREGRTGRYLVEERASGVAPSANIYLRCQKRAGKLGIAPPRTYLLVGEPLLDPKFFPTARPLPEARREIAQIARLYPHAEILVSQDASRRAIQATLSRVDGFHFAGHSFLNGRYPLLSRLALASDGEHSGSLYAREIDDFPLENLRLVILSSCSSAAGASAGSEGALNLARPFLAAGVPEVVASLREVDDSDSAALVVALHRFLATGVRPLDALRAGQLELLRSGDRKLRSPGAWAMFELLGGS
ncbi:MAG TPA: CHAT domain-containing protein [Thermoanaerobaculia bacterium]|nr:CHAT domain-containing protein [Thermoanaerobaculia bacterium]